MKFTKYNNPNKKKHHKARTKSEAMTLACANALWLKRAGYDVSESWIEERTKELQ